MVWTQTDGGGLGQLEGADSAHITGGISGADDNIYASGTSQLHPLGWRRQIGQRVFRYAKFNGTVAAGRLCSTDQSVMIEAAITTPLVNSAGSATDLASGQSTLYLKSSNFTTADAADIFADGYLMTVDVGAHGGYTYDIKSNSQGTLPEGSTVTSVIRIDLYDVTQTSLDSEDKIAIVGNLYNEVVIYDATGGTDHNAVGVTTAAQVDGDFGWLQTWGPCNVLVEADQATATGYIATGSSSDDGAVQGLGDTTIDSEDDVALALVENPPVGYFLAAVADTVNGPVYLQINP